MPNEPAAPTAAEMAPADAALPELQLLSDVVPNLRSDLLIEPRPGEAGLFNVGRADDPGRVFTLYDFEVSLARMLDGHRTVSALIEAAAKIGIPVTLESLRKFVRQMRAYQFVQETPTAATDPGGGWAPRTEWPPEVREMFQSALRTFRNDRLTEARGYLEALLQIQPDVAEAHELLQRIEERILSGEASPRPALDVFQDESGGPPQGDEASFDVDDALASGPGRRWSMLAIAVAALALGGVLAIPVPSRVSASAELSAAGTPERLLSPRSGRIAELLSQPGSWVKAGDKLIRLDTAEVDQRERALQAALTRIDARLQRTVRRAESRSARKAQVALDKKQAQVQSLTRQRDALARSNDGRTRRRLRIVTRSLTKKERELAHLQQSYARASGTEEVKALSDQKTAKQAELAGLAQERARSIIVAAGDGAFETSRRVGDPVHTGEAIGTVVDSRKLRVLLGVPVRQATRVKEGQPVSLRVNGSAAELHTVVSTTSGESAGPGLVRASAVIDNPDRKLAVGANGLAEIDCGSEALFGRLVGGR